MDNKIKPNIKPAANLRPVANIKPALKQERKSQSKLLLYSALLLLLLLLASFMVPVYYVPLFSKITARYGLSGDIARKLTLLDLALNSLGVETPNMASAFRKQNIEYEPDVFYASRFNADVSNRLINAKETYYYEYERTKKRPAEIAGIYQNGKAVNTPEIDGDLKGVRALPKGDFLDDGFTDFSYKQATATTASKDEIMGSKRRQVRGSFDRQGEGAQEQPSKKREPLPDFASSIYNQDEKGETQTLNNSRIVKPIVSGEPFSVKKSEGVIAKLVGDSSFTDSFAALTNFGGYEGALGYYIKDDLPKENLLDFFGISGKDVFTTYFYSHAAVSRKYIESSKHLAEIAFHGDEPQDEILIAKGQKQDKIPTMNEADFSPLSLLLTVKRNMKECEEGRERYDRTIKRLKQDYKIAKNKLRKISNGDVVDGLENMAVRGAPGSCNEYTQIGHFPWGRRTAKLREKWNQLVRTAKEKCIDIRNAEKEYADSCDMVESTRPDKAACEDIEALEVAGGTDWGDVSHGFCRHYIKWHKLNASNHFHGCYSRPACVEAQDILFKEIDENILLETKPGFVFN